MITSNFLNESKTAKKPQKKPNKQKQKQKKAQRDWLKFNLY